MNTGPLYSHDGPIILERLELEMIKATEGNDFDSWEKEPVKFIGRNVSEYSPLLSVSATAGCAVIRLGGCEEEDMNFVHFPYAFVVPTTEVDSPLEISLRKC